MSGSGLSAEAGALLERIAVLPTALRVFSLPRTQAERLYGLDGPLLAAMDQAGLSRPDGDDRRYDGYDCANLALHLKRPSVQRMAMRSWAATLRTVQTAPSLDYRLEIALEPGAAPFAADPVEVMVPGGGRQGLVPAANGTLHAVRGRRPCRPPPFPAPVAALLDEVADIDFFMLPEGARWDLGFLRANRFAECGGCAKWLKSEADRRGLPARLHFGLLLARPYSTPHFWASFLVGTEWVPADPLLIKLLRQTAGLDAADWPLSRSPAAAVLPLAEVRGFRPGDGRPLIDALDPTLDVVNPLALRRGREVAVSLPTDIAAGDGP